MKIAVIGAGLSGLNTAKTLHDNGHQVSVYEKSRGLGGRLANKRFNWGVLDIGAQYFTVKSDIFRREVESWEKAGVVTPWLFSPHKVVNGELVASPDNTLRYTGLPAMNGIAHFLASGLNIHFQKQVVQLQYRKGAWALLMANGGLEEMFDWVVISSPAEQAKELLKDCSKVVHQIPDTIHTPCWALGLETSGYVAPEVQGVFGDDQVSWVSRQSAKPAGSSVSCDTDLWMMHFSPAWSQAQGKQTTENIPALGVQWLQQILQQPLVSHNHYQHYWRYANLIDQTFQSRYLVDQTQQLAVVGAWCCGGRVEGAYLSSFSLIEDFF